MQVYTNKWKCYGCSKCALDCPTGAITMQADEEGFIYPYVDEGRCVECGKCAGQCIANTEKKEEHIVDEVYACVALDDHVLDKSTSGGIGYLLAKKMIESGGVVYGAAYQDGFRVEHIRIDKDADLYKIQGSKYVSSSIVSVLSQIAKDIEAERMLLFSGTPCQVAAVKQWAGDYNKLLCVELACMGCPSPLVWEKHIAEYQNKNGELFSVKFRDKVTGWKTSSLSYFTGVNGENRNSYSAGMDAYLLGFNQALYMRPSCHECKFKGKRTWGDIKIGDFWGIENFDDTYKKNNGVSLVIVETEYGKSYFEEIQDRVKKNKIPYKFALTHNPYIELSRKPSKYRRNFFEEIKQEKVEYIDQIIKKYLNPSFDERERYACQYPVVDNLLKLCTRKDGVCRFFEINNYKKIAVYGVGELGKIFIALLQKEKIDVVCLIDKNYKRFPKLLNGIPVIGPHELEDFDYDCVIVTLVHLYNSVIETLLLQGIDLNKIISIGSIV